MTTSAFSKRYFNHYFYYFQADCMDNQTVHHQCGMENGCIGSMEDWVCVCEAFGWIAHEIDLMQCHKRERLAYTIQKMKFSFKEFLSKCDQIHSFLRISLHLLRKSLMENFIFCAVLCQYYFLFFPSQFDSQTYPLLWYRHKVSLHHLLVS